MTDFGPFFGCALQINGFAGPSAQFDAREGFLFVRPAMGAARKIAVWTNKRPAECAGAGGLGSTVRCDQRQAQVSPDRVAQGRKSAKGAFCPLIAGRISG
jgi:hypothetical protein